MNESIFKIIAQDHDILVVEKRQPFLSQRTDRGGSEALPEFISRTLGQPVFPIHRLDREVLGLMVFALNERAAEHLSSEFRERRVEKSYLAWVYGEPKPSSTTLVHYLLKNSKNNHVTVFTRPTPGAKEAKLSYETIEVVDDQSLLKVQLMTGRSHQIRVQLSKAGHPIIGDDQYFGAKASQRFGFAREGVKIQLRSAELGFQHPSRPEFVRFKLDGSLKTFPFE